jgi:hypothetical protein
MSISEKIGKWQLVGVKYASAIEAVDQRYGSWAAAFLVGLTAELLSFCVASSFYTGILLYRYMPLVPNPFAPGDLGLLPEHRMRILGPTIAWLLGVRGVAAATIPAMANVPILMLLYRMARSLTGVPTSILVSVLMATTHLTMSSRTLLGYSDSLVFLLILGAMASRSIGFGGLCLFLAGFGDQRAVFAIPLVLVWHAWRTDREGEAFRMFFLRGLGYGLAVVAWAAASLYVAHVIQFHQQSSAAYKEFIFLRNFTLQKPGYLHLSYSMTFKAAWIFPLVLIWLWAAKRPWLTLVTVGSLLLILAQSILVHDVSRGVAHCFPAVIMGMLVLAERCPERAFDIIGTCTLVNFITPFYQGTRSGLWVVSYPIVVELPRWILQSR